MLVALIMAGGKGERFWPLSTDKKPKQFLNLVSENTMIQMTVKRLAPIIPIEQIFIVTSREYTEIVKEQIPDLPERNIIVEPVGKNTAPCIGLSAFIIQKYYNDATIMVLPSDHLIIDEAQYLDTLKGAAKFVEENRDSIVTIGIKPNRPETGYGYICFDEFVSNDSENEIMSVKKFVEKPDINTALMYLQAGNFLWNAGMFIWKADTIINLTKKHLTNNYLILKEIAATSDEKFDETLEQRYPEVESISVDYGIMEKADKIYVIPGSFGWDDVGTWYSVERYRPKDADGNIISGNITSVDSSNNIIIGKEKPIVVAGMDDIFVIESDELFFVASKESIKNIKDIKQIITKNNNISN